MNCIPPDHVDGMVSYLRDFTDLPLGVYPNLGYFTNDGWQSDPGVGGEEYARMALRWREEGAQIVGGCCGTGPEHIAAAAGEPRGHAARVAGGPSEQRRQPRTAVVAPSPAAAAGSWTDRRRRELYPLPFPDLVCRPGRGRARAPSASSPGRYLFDEGIGAHQRCLDIGCGAGIVDGAAGPERGVARARDRRRPARGGEHAGQRLPQRRGGPGDRRGGRPLPVGAGRALRGDRGEPAARRRSTPSGRWRGTGRWTTGVAGCSTRCSQKLPQALAPEGVAYVVHLSVVSRLRTLELLDQAGLEGRVAAYSVFEFSEAFAGSREQIARVESLSDAHHVGLGDRDLMVAYLLEVRHAEEPE